MARHSSTAALCLAACLALGLAQLAAAARPVQQQPLKWIVDTQFCVKVRRGIKGVRLIPSQIDETDWGSDTARPDTLFKDVDLTPRFEPYCWGLDTNFWQNPKFTISLAPLPAGRSEPDKAEWESYRMEIDGEYSGFFIKVWRAAMTVLDYHGVPVVSDVDAPWTTVDHQSFEAFGGRVGISWLRPSKNK